MSDRAHGMRIAVTGFLLVCATAAGAQNLEQVEIRPLGDGTRIVLHVQGAMEHKAFRLHEPERIVVDLVGATNAVRVDRRTVPGGPVAQLRVSQFAVTPQPVTRLVADLRQDAEYDVQRRGDEIVLRVHPAGAGGLTPEEGAALQETAAADAGAMWEESRLDQPPWSQGTENVSVPIATAEAGSADTATLADAASLERNEVEAVEAPATPAGETVPTPFAAVTPVTPSSEPVERLSAPESSVEELFPVPVVPQETQVAQRQVDETVAAVGAVQPATTQAVDTTVGAAAGQDITALDRPRIGRPWSPPASSEDTSPRLQMNESRSRRINLDVQGADIRTVLRTLADYSGTNIIASRDVEGEVSAHLEDAPWQAALEAILKAHGYGYVEEDGIIRVGVLQKIRSEELEEAAADRKREELLPIETVVVRLEYAAADELQKSLKEMLTTRGRLQVDERTNALIVSDIPNSVARIAEMAKSLDSRTPQVEIVSKLIDVGAEDSENLGIRWSAANLRAGDALAGAGVDAGVAGAAGGLRIGTVQSWGQLDMMLEAMARSRKANIVSNPNITTVNNREAKILVGAKIPLIVADEAGNAVTQLTTIGIQMRVTPHVNSDKTITLDLHPEVSDLSSQATVQGGVIINTSEADTRVIVEDGETAIIGGLIRDVKSEVITGIPVLKDLPGVGWLFRNRSDTNDKRELIIFVTPRMIERNVTVGQSN